MTKKILAGIVVFNPEKNLINLVDSLLCQDVEVFLYVNKSNFISEIILKSRKVKYFKSKTNNGISIAINKIIKNFMKFNYDFLFTFDQDSMINKNFIKEMINIFVKARNIDKNIISCAPLILDIKFKENKYSNIFSTNKMKEFQYINFAITSGSLFLKSSFEKVGLMNELLFIDGVDTDWCERANLLKFKLIKSNNVYLKHKIGSKYINIFGFRKSYHDQNLRVYYIMRNSIFLLFFGQNTFIWKLSELLRALIRLVAYPLLSSTKLKTIYFIFLAFKDGLLKTMGKMKYIEH